MYVYFLLMNYIKLYIEAIYFNFIYVSCELTLKSGLLIKRIILAEPSKKAVLNICII